MRFKLIVGLGNPEKKYLHTYHNTGARAVEYLKEKIDSEAPEQEHPYGKVWKTDKGILMIPSSFMNESGKSVAKAIKELLVAPEQLLVIHDDADLEIGRWKLSWDRSDGGHRGLRSIIEYIGTKKFYRFRIGIREKQDEKDLHSNPRLSAGDFVLQKITPADKEKLQESFAACYGLIAKETEKETR